MPEWWKDCGLPDDLGLSPKISAVQMDAITWPREPSRRWLGYKLSPARANQRSYKLSSDPDLARRINDFLARYADQ